ncbi:plasmid stabilization protein [Opitutaceae bacterium TAV5]|nr:plasmid stabilization protein [Opitutaceae bacterium TAV5]
MNPCRLHPEADAEYAAAAEYYASVRSGLGGRFYDEIERLIAAIRTDPLLGREIQPSIRWRLSSIFPYAVIYSNTPEGILIWAIMHLRREPAYWLHRLN